MFKPVIVSEQENINDKDIISNRLEGSPLKVIILGAEQIGLETAKDLIKNQNIQNIAIADKNEEKSKKVCEQLQSDKLIPISVNAKNYEEMKNVVKPYDLLINTLTYEYIVPVAHAAIHSRVHAVDRGGHLRYFTHFLFMLHEQAKKTGVTYIPDLGISPGISNILSSYGAHLYDRIESLKIYAGSIPIKDNSPLQHKHFFPIPHLLDQYNDLSFIIRDNKRKFIPSLTGIESIQFENYSNLEAFYTAEGPSTLHHSYPQLQTYEHKTIRHQGHVKKMQLLKDLHLTRNDYSVFMNKTTKIKPREFFIKIAGSYLALGNESDVVLLKIYMTGKKNEHAIAQTYEFICKKESNGATSATAYVIGNTLSIASQMILDETIATKGVFPPEKIIPSKQFIHEMRKRNMKINEYTNML